MQPPDRKDRRIVVVGATGATGARVINLAAKAGLRPVAVARRADALAAVVDGLDAEARTATLRADDLDVAFADAAVVVSGIGPSTVYGHDIVEACMRAGASYIDFSGEPRWVEHLRARFSDPARAAGLTLAPAVGLGIAADLAAAAVATRVGTVRQLTVAYRIVGMRPSVATTRSLLEIFAGGAPLVSPDGVRFVPAGRATAPLRGVRFPTPDALVLRTVYPEATIQTVMQLPALALAGRTMAGIGTALRRPRLAGVARRALSAWADRPSAHDHAGGGVATLTVRADGDSQSATVVARVHDVYDTTALGGFLAARALLSGDGPPGFVSWGAVTGTGPDIQAAAGVEMMSLDVY